MGGPYPPAVAGQGGIPTVKTDIPVCAVFIFLYLCFAVTNQIIWRINRRKGHKFFLSFLLFGFCMARVGTLVLRIAWSTRQRNISLAIAAQILVNAGILIVYIVNLLLAQRILRAKQPRIGWNSILRMIYKILYILIGGALVMVITATVVSLYTLNVHTRSATRDVQLTGLSYLLAFTCLPAFHLAAAFLLPKSKEEETFGTGSMKSKVIILTTSTCLCMLIAGFKAGVAYSAPRPIAHPAWYHSKACFYVFNFTCEILILSLLTFSRIDQRFHVPNGCKKAGDYTLKRSDNVENQETSSPRISSLDTKGETLESPQTDDEFHYGKA